MYPYYVLNLEHDASDEEVAARYRDLVVAFPPDRAPDRFREIRAAYEALRDRRRRIRTRLFYIDTAGVRARRTPPRLRGATRRMEPEALAEALRAAPLPQGAAADRPAGPGDAPGGERPHAKGGKP